MFCSNVSGGITKTTSPMRWENSWENNRDLAILAEQAGVDFMLPLANWMGLGGNAASENNVLETITWATALLEATHSITIFATVHAPFVHPLFAAKQIVTADHIGRGRIGLNIVSGSVPQEFEAFGRRIPSHDERYALSDEWLTIAKRLWTEYAPFSHSGSYFNLKGVISEPKPWGGTRPLIISAGSSPTGRAFARQHADCLFILILSLDQLPEEIKVIRSGTDREFGVYASGHMFCRKTRREAEEYYHYLVHEHGDWAAADFLINVHKANGTIPPEVSPLLRERFVSGSGTFMVQGDPDDVAAQFKRMSDAGLDGMALALPNFLHDFGILRDEVLPRLERMGLRAEGPSPVH